MIRVRRSLGGVVSAPHHLAAAAGAEILRDGGGAVEAMVAAAAAIAVVYPHMNALGGDGFWLIAPKDGAPIAIQACGPAGRRATPEFYRDLGSAAIPTRGPGAALTVAGTVSGWAEALRVAADMGARLPLARLLEPAIRHARDGAPVTASHAALLREKWDELAPAPGFADVFAPGGPPAEGSVFKQPQLAETLARLASAGLDDFYRGALARRMAAGLEAAGSPLRLEDLEAYRARRVDPAEARLSTGTVWTQPPPSQGVSTLMILRLFERLGVREPDGFEHVHGLVEATKRAFLRRDRDLGDPSAMEVEWRSWLSDATIASEAAAIDPIRAAPWPQSGAPGDTVWLGAADSDGVAVSFIQSIYWEFGAGVVAGDTGVLWQNRGSSFTLPVDRAEGPRVLAPGRLPFHTLAPALARLSDGRTVAFGTMGGDGQPQTSAAIFTRHALFDVDMQAAITAPRWLLGRTWGDETTTLKLESRVDPALAQALREAGHDVEMIDAFDDRVGHAGMVGVDAAGVLSGASDPRADGGCATV